MARCQRSGCDHTRRNHIARTGPCCRLPADHCSSFVDSPEPPPPASVPVPVSGLVESSSVGAFTSSVGSGGEVPPTPVPFVGVQEAPSIGIFAPSVGASGGNLAVDSRGTWALKQVTTPTSIGAADITTALGFSGVRGLAVRFGWSSIADADGNLITTSLDAARAKADAHGVELSVRFMAGRYLPAALYDAMGSNHYYTLTTQAPGARVPLPFSKAGVTGNPVFEAAYTNLVAQLATWCRSNGVYLMHLPWYGRLYAEYNADSDIQAVQGWSLQRCIDGNLALLDDGFAATGPDLACSYTSSGLFANGTATQIINANHNQMIALWGSNDPQIQTLSTGLGKYQLAGQTINPGGVQNIYDGEQMYDGTQNTAYHWADLFSTCFNSGINWVEVYTPSFTFGGSQPYQATALQTAITTFNADWGISP